MAQAWPKQEPSAEARSVPSAHDPERRLAAAGFASTPEQFLLTAQRRGPAAALYVRTEAGWEPTSWQAYAREAQQAARALAALGVQPGDAVAILSFNRPEWSVGAMAAMLAGAAPAGIYWTSSGEDIEYILNHSRASVLLCENTERFEKVAARLQRLPDLKHVVMMRDAPADHPIQLAWETFLERGQQTPASEIDRRLRAIGPQDTASLIYTSGTTGPAKAVVLSHANMAWTAQTMLQQFGATESDRLLSYLPMAHVAEQLGCIHNQAWCGASVYFARRMEELGDHLKEVRPSVFFGVPRVWEKMQDAITAKLAAATGPKAAIARWALHVGERWHAADMDGRAPGAWLTLQKGLAHRLIHRKIKEALGFDQARLLISGAAPIAPEKLRFFTGLDIVVRELYGQSEVAGPTTLSAAGQTRIGSVGKALPGIDIRIADDGEILVRSPGNFQGYAGRPDATAEALVDGWLHTGDLGRVDADGYLYVTGRKKDLIITSGGKNISPANLEAELMAAPLIEHAVVCGDNRHYLVALLTLNAEALQALAQAEQLGTEPGTLHGHPRVQAALQQAVDNVNARQARVAHIRKFAVLRQPLTVEGGELTPTLKVKRQVVLKRQAHVVDQLYAN